MMDIKGLTLGFIGYGNIAQAMAQGLLKTGTLEPEQICACARDWEKLCRTAEGSGIRPFREAAQVAGQADIVVLAVKPHLIEQVTAPILGLLQKKIVVSVAAGRLFDWYEQVLLPGTHHLSTLPNTPVSVGEGIVICEQRHSLTPEEYGLVEGLFSRLGLVQAVESGQLGIAGTISGCGPAFASLFMEALGDAAVLHGLPRALAYQLAGQMMAGTGKLLVETGLHPGAMKDAVCSPGGTTIVGVSALERGGLRAAVIDAVDSIQRK